MNVVVMRRELTDQELIALKQFFPEKPIQAHRTEPQSASEHLEDCQRLDARIAFLPHEQPIPIPAMEAGVKHLLLKDGKLMELVRVVPEFRPFIRED